MHRTENTDDDQADGDGGEGHPLGIPPQPPGSFVVSVIVAVLRHDCEDQSHDIDWVRWAKTRDNGVMGTKQRPNVVEKEESGAQ